MSEYNYKSPINMWITKAQEDFERKVDEQVYKEVINVGISVDKKELLKALEYDRNQYEKGFKDGVQSIIKDINEILVKY